MHAEEPPWWTEESQRDEIDLFSLQGCCACRWGRRENFTSLFFIILACPTFMIIPLVAPTTQEIIFPELESPAAVERNVGKLNCHAMGGRILSNSFFCENMTFKTIWYNKSNGWQIFSNFYRSLRIGKHIWAGMQEGVSCWMCTLKHSETVPGW